MGPPHAITRGTACRARALAVLVLALGLGGAQCLAVVGPFALIVPGGAFGDTTRFRPTTTGFALVDAHEEVDGGFGSVVVVERPQPRLVVFLSAASFDPELDLAALSAADREVLLAEVRRGDLFLLEDLPTSEVAPNREVTAHHPVGTADAFTFVVQRPDVGTRNNDYTTAARLGSQQTVSLLPASVDLDPYGRVDFQPIRITAAPGPEQGGTPKPSTGSVTLRASIPVIAERLGESNLRILREAVREP